MGEISDSQINWTVARSLETLAAKSPLKELQNETLAILVDGDWKDSSGFWKEDLVDPENHPAIKITPSAITNVRAAKRLIAHEFTHLLNARYHPDEESWMREGLALWAEHKESRDYGPWLSAGFEFPERSLLTNLGTDSSAQKLYGQLELFFVYLQKRCGDDVMTALLKDPSQERGVGLVREVIKKRSTASCRSFDDVFKDFSRDRFLGRLVPADLRSPVREEKLLLDQPFSSTAYHAQSASECAEGDLWMEQISACLRYRLD